MDSDPSKLSLELTKSEIHLRRDTLRPPPPRLLFTPSGMTTTWLTTWPSSRSTRSNSTVNNWFDLFKLDHLITQQTLFTLRKLYSYIKGLVVSFDNLAFCYQFNINSIHNILMEIETDSKIWTRTIQTSWFHFGTKHWSNTKNQPKNQIIVNTILKGRGCADEQINSFAHVCACASSCACAHATSIFGMTSYDHKNMTSKSANSIS